MVPDPRVFSFEKVPLSFSKHFFSLFALIQSKPKLRIIALIYENKAVFTGTDPHRSISKLATIGLAFTWAR